MPLDFTSYSILFILTAILALVLAVITGGIRQGVPGSKSFALLMLCSAIWLFFVALEDSAIELQDKILWAKIEYFGIPYAGPLLLTFVLLYTRQNHYLTRRNLIILFTIPALATILAASNELHHLVWTTITLSTQYPRLGVFGHGPFFWFVVANTYLTVVLAIYLLLRAIRRSPSIYRQQAAGLVTAVIIPVLANIIYVSELSPVHGLDLTPFGFIIAGIIMVFTVFRFQLFDLVPVAREALIETMPDAVLVLDKQGRVADLNPAACVLFNCTSRSILGQEIDKAIPDLAKYRTTPEIQEEATLPGRQTRYFELRILPLRDRNNGTSGRLLVLHDITVRKQAQQELERLYDVERLRVMELNALRSIAVDLSTDFELKTLLNQIVQRAGELLEGITAGELCLYDPAHNDLEILVSKGAGGDKSGKRMALGEGVMGIVAQTHTPMIIENYAAWEGHSPQYEDVGNFTTIGVPLMAGTEFLGALVVGGDRNLKTFTNQEVDLLNLFAQEAAVAIRNARLFERTKELAIRDSLTGLYNRRHFFYLGGLEVERAVRYHKPLAAIMIDLDNFKRVNDTCGHAAGDLVLQNIAGLCEQTLRKIDLIGRYGGEEFSILLPETGPENALAAAERLNRLIAEAVHHTPSGPVRLTASLGLAILNPAQPDLDLLMNQADQALYEAKKTRNTVRVFQSE